MKRPSAYLKMKVLGAIEFAEGNTVRQRVKAVSEQSFEDEQGVKSQKTVVRRASKISNYARRSHERGFVNLAKVGFLYLRVLVMRVSQKGGFLAH